MNYWIILIIALVVYLLVNNNEAFAATSPLPSTYPSLIDDDDKHPSLIDSCQFYEYDLQRLKGNYNKCSDSHNHNPYKGYKAPTVDLSPVKYGCTRCTDPKHYTKYHDNYNNSIQNNQFYAPRAPLIEGFHKPECTDEECYCD